MSVAPRSQGPSTSSRGRLKGRPKMTDADEPVAESEVESELHGRMRVLLALIQTAGYEGFFRRMPEGFFEDAAVRRATFMALPDRVQDIVLSVGLSTCFGVFADARSEAECDRAKRKLAVENELGAES
jgi:hypothetical protein